MALSIISNQAASIATRSLGQANDAATATAEKLSSGKRINSAKDDAAGSAIAARLSAEVAGLQQAGVNAGQASSMLQIADGASQNVEDILIRAKSLSVQAGSEQISDVERNFLDQEFQALKDEIDRIAADTEFNGTKLVNGDIEEAGAVIMGSGGVTGVVAQGVTFSGTTTNNNLDLTVTNIGTGALAASGDTAQAMVMGTFAGVNTFSGATTTFMGTVTATVVVDAANMVMLQSGQTVTLAATGQLGMGTLQAMLDTGAFSLGTSTSKSLAGKELGDLSGL
ncbi:hypothetical protein CKO28_23630 [Rhodovibrio sodomensis]|uniref:Flagellin N-terminal domain-containing protein n=1 Tax=Rhodovibrio sodomensis TaxID=1088 RepID=A0ABS1DM33_9PROT|nr:flagellin [Rhodovibrio sodomensis]MBK1671002.1 hypothetical protein [Rhodovibrio sodomensis]